MNGVIILTGLSFVISIVLVFVNSKLKQESNKIDELLKLLPGVNCGMCGYNTCEGMANVLLNDKEAYKKCKILRGEKVEEMKKFLSKKEI